MPSSTELANAGMARKPAQHVDLRSSLGDLLIALKHVFVALARAD